MKYELSQAKTWVDSETKNKLQELGFVFTKEKDRSFGEWYYQSSIKSNIEINTLEQPKRAEPYFGTGKGLMLRPDKSQLIDFYNQAVL